MQPFWSVIGLWSNADPPFRSQNPPSPAQPTFSSTYVPVALLPNDLFYSHHWFFSFPRHEMLETLILNSLSCSLHFSYHEKHLILFPKHNLFKLTKIFPLSCILISYEGNFSLFRFVILFPRLGENKIFLMEIFIIIVIISFLYFSYLF